MSNSELDSQLNFFIFEVSKLNGDRYPSNSLRDLFQGIGYHMMHILQKNCKIFSGDEFVASRAALDAAMKLATKDGVVPSGSGPASPISSNEEELLWKNHVLGDETPIQLIRTIFYYTGKFFALRGGKEHRELEWGKQVQLQQTSDGEILIYSSNYSKNYTGGLKHANIRPKEIKVYANKDDPCRCFIIFYKKYASLRPESDKCSAFYLKCKSYYNTKTWFDNVPMGHNTLSNMVKNMCNLAGLQGGNYVNHSLKKTAATTLKNCSEAQRRAITGNRSASQATYECITNEDYRQTSALLYSANSKKITQNTIQSEMSTSTTQIQITDESVEIKQPLLKKMKIEVDADNNKLTFTFE